MNRRSFMVVAVLFAVTAVVVNAKASSSDDDMFLNLVRQRSCRDGLCVGNDNNKKESIIDQDSLQDDAERTRCMSANCMLRRAKSGTNDSDWELEDEDGDDKKKRLSTKKTYKSKRCLAWQCARGFPSKREVKKIDISRASVTDTQSKKRCLSWKCHGKRFFGAVKSNDAKDTAKRNVHGLDGFDSHQVRLKKQRDSRYKCLSWDCDKRKADSLPDSAFSATPVDEPSRRFRAFLIQRRSRIGDWQYPEN